MISTRRSRTKADYFSGKRVAYIDELVIIPVPEDSVRADGVGTSEYHFADALTPDQYDVVKGQANVSPITVKPYYWTVWHFNKKKSVFKELKLRQAALAAMSMDPIAKASIGRDDFYRLGPEHGGTGDRPGTTTRAKMSTTSRTRTRPRR